MTISGSIADRVGDGTAPSSGGVIKIGSGILTLSGTNTYSQSTTILGGVLQFAKQASLYGGTSASWTAANITTGSGATLALNVGGVGEFTASDITTIAAIGTGTSGFQNGSTIAFDTTNASGGAFAYSGSIANTNGGSNTLGLLKKGAGALTLSGNSTYTGPTTVNVGGLVLNGSLAVGSNLSVAAAAWLGGTGTAAGVVTVSGTLSPGNSPGVITLGSLVLTSTSVTAIEVASAGTRGTAYDGVTILDASGLTYGGTMAFAFGGSAIADNTTLDIFSFTGSAAGDFATLVSTGFYAGTWTNNSDGTFTFAKDSQTLTFRESTGDVIVVPEPGTALLGVIGALAALASRRGMRRRSFV
jgi:autotransporter-associated beta strand protein